MKHILPWVHLAEVFQSSKLRLRLVLERIPIGTEKCLAQLFVGNSNQPVSDVYGLIAQPEQLSIRQREALRILARSSRGLSKDGFTLDLPFLNSFFYFANEIVIEIKNMGTLVPSSYRATIKAVIKGELDEELTLHFNLFDHSGVLIDDPMIFGTHETMLLDKNAHISLLDSALRPEETRALLQAEPLPVEALWEEQARSTFESLASLGIDMSCLKEMALAGTKATKIILRILLGKSAAGELLLRLHLVTEIEHNGQRDEVEIPSIGALAPVYPTFVSDPPKLVLIKRNNEQEEAARQAIFALSATASSQNRGFVASGDRVLHVLSTILKHRAIPDFVELDRDTLPHIIELPAKPILRFRKVEEFETGKFFASLDLLGEEGVKIPFTTIVDSASKGLNAFVFEDDTVVTFSLSSADTIAMLSDILELKDQTSKKQISLAEAALIYCAFESQIVIDCEPDVKERLGGFTGKLTAFDQALPRDLQTALRPYQHDAVAWLSQLHRAGLGRLLADDMGLGKTLMVLVMLSKIKESEKSMPSLVVAPTSVIDVWLGEAKKHTPGLKLHKWHGINRLDQLDDVMNADLVVTSYALLRRDIAQIFSKMQFRYLILDEAQIVKNPRTESWQAARQINCYQKVALTGTPIENRVEDLWSILELVAPGALGTERAFQKRYAIPISKGSVERVAELKKRVFPIVLRRTKNEVERDLPPKIESVLKCEMTPGQKELYRNIIGSIAHDFKDILFSSQADKSRLPMLAALTRLRQVCCDPRIMLKDEAKNKDYGSAKGRLLQEVLEECLAAGRRIIIYSQFVTMQNIIHELLKESGVNNALWLHGGTRDRGAVVEAFQRPDGPRVIVVSLKAGGTGITLTAADTVIFYDPWWNPAVEDQAADRAHRIGQTKTVHVIKLICEDSIEEQIHALSLQKRASAASLLSGDARSMRSLSLQDIQQLLAVEIQRTKA